MKNLSSIRQNIYLLYFLFFATIVHLGYFLLKSESQSIVIFSLVFLFVYLIDTNMVIVLGISLVFTDLLYMIQKMPEGFTAKKDVSGNDISGNMTKGNMTKGNMTEGLTNKKKKGMNKKKENMTNKDKEEEYEDAVNPLVEASETIGKEKMEGKNLEDVQEDSKKMKSVLDKLKNTPEMVDSLKTLNGIDIHELNKLINNLNTVVDSFSM
jgi:hypothetical protein